jgi:hypothetical protein
MASAEKPGKAATRHMEIKHKRQNSAPLGQAEREKIKSMSAMSPAPAARPAVMKITLISATAMRIIGKVTPKMLTPTKPRTSPSTGLCRPVVESEETVKAAPQCWFR